MRSVNLFAALAASYLTGFAADAYAASGFGHEALSPGACASGYHPAAGGECQPDVGEVNRFCPAGGVYHPAPHGWYCENVETAAPQEPRPEFHPQLRPRPYHAERTRERPHAAPLAVPLAAPRARVARHGARRAVVAEQPSDLPRSVTAPVAPVNPGGTNTQPTQSGGGGGGGGGGGWSDRRLKRDIVWLGLSPSGLPIYSFQYVWGGPRYVGVMAQDLLKLRPEAVIFDECGYYRVDYAKIDVAMREEVLAA